LWDDRADRLGVAQVLFCLCEQLVQPLRVLDEEERDPHARHCFDSTPAASGGTLKREVHFRPYRILATHQVYHVVLGRGRAVYGQELVAWLQRTANHWTRARSARDRESDSGPSEDDT